MWMFGIGIILIYNLFLFYIGYNGWVWLKSLSGERKSLKYIFWCFLLLFAYSFIIGRWLGDHLILTWFGAIWLALFFFLILFLPLANITVFLFRFSRISRRKTVKWTGFILCFIFVFLFVIGLYNAYNPVVRTYNLSIPKKVEGKQGLRIIMASDMHFGPMAGNKQAKKLVGKINSLQPDLVLFPGDIIDDSVKPFLQEGIPEILKQIKAPVYASLGNHDRDHNVDLINVFNHSGMNVLDDDAVFIEEGITLVGRKDRGYRDVMRAELSKLMKEVDVSKPVILLEHQPYDLDIAEKHGVDLIVSGHTHRGQIAPAHLITERLFENDWGYYQKGQLQSIVSSGYGFWGIPVRIGTRSEIVQINITFLPQK